MPIGCAGVAVFPGDIMAGDKDGVVVVPRALKKNAEDAPEQERYEHFVRTEATEGCSIIGLYPTSDKSRSDYEKWNKDRL